METYILDECGKCLATEDITRDACIGCDNVANSGKEYNECGICVDKNDTNFNDYGRDCSGFCITDTSWNYYVDDCGKCLIPFDAEWNECLPTLSTTKISNEDGKDIVYVRRTVLIGGIVIIALLVICGVLIGICIQFRRLRYKEYKLQEKMIINNQLEGQQPGQEVDESECVEGQTFNDAVDTVQTL